MLGQRTVCTRDENHHVNEGDRFCDQCGQPTKLVADGATQLAAHTTETRLLRYKCGRCGTQVDANARKCSHCSAIFGTQVDIIDWSQKSAKELGRWQDPKDQHAPVAAFVPSGPIPGGAFDTSAHTPLPQNKWRWIVPVLLLLLLIAVGAVGLIAIDASNRAARAEQALRDMPQQAAIIPVPTDVPTPTPTSQPTAQPTQAQPTQAQAAAPTAANTATPLPPTAIPDTRPQFETDVELHEGTPAGQVNANLISGDRFKPSYWMNVGGETYLYATTDYGVGWFNANAASSFDFSQLAELVLVNGVKADYQNRGGFITIFNNKPIAWAFTDGTYTQRVSIGDSGDLAITDGDFLRVVRREGTTLFFVAVTNNVDGEVALNTEGAVPEWVVTGENVPPAPTPVPTTTTSNNGGGSNTSKECPNGLANAANFYWTGQQSNSGSGSTKIQATIVLPGCTTYKGLGLRAAGDPTGDRVSTTYGGWLVGPGQHTILVMRFEKGKAVELGRITVNVGEGETVNIYFYPKR